MKVERYGYTFELENDFSYCFPKPTGTQRPIVRVDLLYGLRLLCKDIIERLGTYDISVLEIGSYCGESSVEFAKIFSEVHCVDPWLNGYDENDDSSIKSPMNDVFENFKFITRNFKNIRYHKMTSKKYQEASYREFDFIYIDGLHTLDGVYEDLQCWWNRTHRLIGGHDFGLFGVREAIQKFARVDLDIKNLPVKIFPDTSWIIDKTEIKNA